MNTTESAGPEERFQRARLLVEMRRPREALALLQEITAEAPEDADAWCLVAEAFFDLGDYERSLKAADAAVQADLYGTDGHLWRCRSFIAQGAAQAALEAARQGMELTHYDPEVRWVLARALLECGQIDDAEEELKLLSEAFPEDAEVEWLQGRLAWARQDLDAADAAFSSATERDPEYDAAWASLGEVRKSQDRTPDAVHCYYQAARSAPLKDEYRREVVQLVDRLVRERGKVPFSTLGVIEWFYVVVFFGSSCFVISFLPLIIPVVVGLFLGGKAIRAGLLRSVLDTLLPEVGAYYRTAKPIQDREDTRSTWQGCGIVLGFIAVIVAIVQLVQRGLLVNALRIALVSVLVVPWLWSWFARRRARPPRDQIEFRFPGDPSPEGTEPGPAVPLNTDPCEIAWSQLWKGQPEAALKTARQIVVMNPEDAAGFQCLSLALLATGDLEGGLTAARQARILDPKTSDYTGLVWLNLAAAGEMDAAVGEAEEDPQQLEACLSPLADMISFMRAAGAHEVARAGTALVLKVAPGSAPAFSLMGEWATVERRWADAEAAYRRALSLVPEKAAYLNNLGTVMWSQRRFREAHRYWNQALRVDPSCHQAATNLKHDIERLDLIPALGLSVVSGAAALGPTLTGSLRNDWMPWATFAGPMLMVALTVPIRWLAIRLIAPALIHDPRLAPSNSVSLWGVGILSTLVLLVIHSLQAWLEIALHPGLFAARWPGAATITFLTAYAWMLLVVRRATRSG